MRELTQRLLNDRIRGRLVSIHLSINYRRAAIADLTILLQLVQEFHENENLPFDESIDRDVLMDFLADESLGQAWLIQQEEKVIGYIVLTLSYSLEYRGRDAYIDEFYIRSQYRGQGIGTKALAFVENTCRTLEIRALHLEVDFDNADAQRLYRKVGYQSHDRFFMTKQLLNAE